MSLYIFHFLLRGVVNLDFGKHWDFVPTVLTPLPSQKWGYQKQQNKKSSLFCISGYSIRIKELKLKHIIFFMKDLIFWLGRRMGGSNTLMRWRGRALTNWFLSSSPSPLLFIAPHQPTSIVSSFIHHLHKYTNTNTQVQIHKYKTSNTKIHIHKYKYTN